MQRVLLTILPPVWPKMPPMGIGYIQSYLAQNGIKADIFDANNLFYNLAGNELQKEWLISCNAHLEDKLPMILQSDFTRAYAGAVAKMAEYDVIGFSCFKSNFKTTAETIKNIEASNSSVKIVIGGPEITRQYFKHDGELPPEISSLADFIIIGEGEKAFLDYLKGAILKQAEFYEMSDLSSLPFPAYTGIDFNNYPRKDAVSLIFSRGCVRKCAFCSERLLYKKFRTRPVQNVINEIEYHKNTNNIQHFVFNDSAINIDLPALDSLCSAIISRFGSIKWEAQFMIRSDMKPELLDKIRQSGCYNLFIGLESGSDKTLTRMRKGFTASHAVETFKMLNHAGLSFGVSMITGYPGETYDDFMDSLEFLVKNKNLIPKIEQANPFTYYEGTEMNAPDGSCSGYSSLKMFDYFIEQIKKHGFKHTNAFLGNLLEKEDALQGS